MDDLFSEVAGEFADINRAMTKVTKHVQNTNKFLSEKVMPVEVWLGDEPVWKGGVTRRVRISDEEVRTWQPALLLGYCCVDQMWQLATKFVEFEILKDEWERQIAVVIGRGEPKALVTAELEFQRQAFYPVPRLLRRILIREKLVTKLLWSLERWT